jgi:adenylate cyclase
MTENQVKRRLAAVLSADVVGYSRLMEKDELGTLNALRERRTRILEPQVKKHSGRVVKVMGDGVLVEFASAVHAVACAVELQKEMAAANANLPGDRCILLRVGINLGDLIIEGSDLYGDSVNIAARLQTLAEPGGIVISAKVHKEVERNLPLTYVDIGERSVKNISAPVHALSVRHGEEHEAGQRAASQFSPESVLSKPAVAVLPFVNLSGDPAQDYFADGVTEDLITALSAWRCFPVIAGNSTFAYKGKAVPVGKVGAELGVRYVLEGSVRRAGDRVRITAQLIEASTAHHLWGQNFDREIGDVFALQDEITRAIVGSIEPQLTRVEQQRALRKHPDSLDAWDLSLQALARIRRGTTRAFADANQLLERAVVLDRSSSYAQSLLALTRFQTALSGWAADPAGSLMSTYEAAREAVELDDCDWLGHALLGIATLWTRRAYDLAASEEEAAITLNPSAAMAYHFFGCVMVFDGQPEAALPRLHAVPKLDPRFELLPTTFADTGLAHFLVGDLEKAVQSCERAIGEQPGHVRAWQRKATALGIWGKIDEAKAAFTQVLKLQPSFSRSYLETTYPFRNPAHFGMLEEGLRRAGWSG